VNVEFESNLHPFYANMLFSKSSEEHCIIQVPQSRCSVSKSRFKLFASHIWSMTANQKIAA